MGNENIQVYIRIKPNGDKRSSIEVISDREIGMREKCGKKSLTFSKVFSPTSNQQNIYETVGRPLVNDILSGYSCTLFAYGQSGSGKTFTILGEKSPATSLGWEENTHAGVIPRCLSQILDEADRMQNEVIVQISSILIYNEELYDLLSSNEEIKFRLYDDPTKKGTVVPGLENVIVRNKNEAFNVMDRVLSKKEELTSTNNVCSSRFHSIFTISVTVKDNSIQGEECYRLGKLCFVDVGGSDNSKGANADKSGWDSNRVNLSLLTLGRVINSLFTHSSHIPYRESKLTRLVRDSLGGCSKTCIVACIKPSVGDIDETVNTLDLMNKAKMIINQPQINEKVNVESLVKKYTEDIVRLRKDIEANKTQTGVYVDDENYKQMQNKILSLERTVIELQKMKAMLEQDARNKLIQHQTLSKKLEEKEQEINELTETLVVPYNQTKQRLETVYSLFKQSATQNKTFLGKVNQMRGTEGKNNALIRREANRITSRCAKLSEKLKTCNNMHTLRGEQLTDNVIKHTEKASGDRSELLNLMVDDAKETQTQILTPCQERLEKTGKDIFHLSEKIDNSQSRILELLYRNKKTLDEFANNEVCEILADSSLENKFAEQQLKLKQIEDTIKSSLAKVLESTDCSTAELKDLVSSSKSEMTLMIQNLFISKMEEIASLRAANNKKLEESGKELTVNEELLLKLQDHLNDATVMDAINDLNITESISENENSKITADEAYSKLIKNLEENLEMMDEFRQGFSEESKSVIEKMKVGLGEHGENIGALSSAIQTIKSQDRTACLELVKNKASEFTSNLSNASNEQKKVLQATDQAINVETTNCKTAISDRLKENKENIVANMKKIEQHMKLSSELNEKIILNSQHQLSLHNSIFNGELKNYKATGETPQRQEYRFPQKLAEMSPYERNRRRLETSIKEEEDLSE
ncbi:kinesin-like protein KIF11-B [Nilaparvata lugens]|uniref:kinesin-like protein KIF11-B n=1 Tax=Nilaparvata lugens TaxID=108931 RepID=UPI00193CE6E8|nr:kinesin-like protein KIF11-B [Nilaparvata lugens]